MPETQKMSFVQSLETAKQALFGAYLALTVYRTARALLSMSNEPPDPRPVDEVLARWRIVGRVSYDTPQRVPYDHPSYALQSMLRKAAMRGHPSGVSFFAAQYIALSPVVRTGPAPSDRVTMISHGGRYREAHRVTESTHQFVVGLSERREDLGGMRVGRVVFKLRKGQVEYGDGFVTFVGHEGLVSLEVPDVEVRDRYMKPVRFRSLFQTAIEHPAYQMGLDVSTSVTTSSVKGDTEEARVSVQLAA